MSFQWEQLEQHNPPLALKSSETQPAPTDAEEDLAGELFIGSPDLLDSANPKSWTLDRRKAAAQQLLQYLFDIGYSVSSARVHPKREDITPAFEQLVAAGSAFQTHHFSGSRRAYNHELHELSATGPKRTAALTARPKITTIDKQTIRAIIETWWGRKRLG